MEEAASTSFGHIALAECILPSHSADRYMQPPFFEESTFCMELVRAITACLGPETGGSGPSTKVASFAFLFGI